MSQPSYPPFLPARPTVPSGPCTDRPSRPVSQPSHSAHVSFFSSGPCPNRSTIPMSQSSFTIKDIHHRTVQMAILNQQPNHIIEDTPSEISPVEKNSSLGPWKSPISIGIGVLQSCKHVPSLIAPHQPPALIVTTGKITSAFLPL